MLKNILASEKLPHAWLFSGPRGIGKTSTARILAKFVNCTGSGPAKNKPCGECDMCREITAGTAVDVMEIDAASNRGIDEIRDLREKIRLAPMKAKCKVFIVDEVHMLTAEAANALLKTLEEPPENTFFLLCTTEPDKLPTTVVSRCTRIQFKKPTIKEMTDKLGKVAVAEKIKFDKEGLEAVAKAARGSFRDAIKLFEQIWLSEGEVTEEKAARGLGMLEALGPEKFTAMIRAGKTREGLEFVEKLATHGVNLRRFTESCVEVLREELLNNYNDSIIKKSLVGQIEGLERVYEQLKTTAVPQLPLEIFVIQNGSGSEDEYIQPEVAKQKPLKNRVRDEASAAAGKYSLDDVRTKWTDIMRKVKPKNHSVEALLRSTKPMGFDGRTLKLEVFYKFHLDKLGSDKCRMIVEDAVGEVFGVGPVRLALQLGEKIKPQKEEISGEDVGEDIIRAAEAIFKVEAI